VNVEDALTTFRQQWQHELETSPQHESRNTSPVNTKVKGGEEESNMNVENEVSGQLLCVTYFFRSLLSIISGTGAAIWSKTKFGPTEECRLLGCYAMWLL
jgi:hypothetical protein